MPVALGGVVRVAEDAQKLAVCRQTVQRLAFRRVLHVAQHEFPISQTLVFLNFLTNILMYRNGTTFCSSPKATCSEYFTFYLFEENSSQKTKEIAGKKRFLQLVILKILKKLDVVFSSCNPKFGGAGESATPFSAILSQGFRMSVETLQIVLNELHYLKAF